MVLYRVYSQEYRIRYFAHPCSTAVLFQIVCLLITFLGPLFTSYFTSGFYYKELTYSEQPNVSYHGQYYLTIDTLSTSTPYFSSSDARLNNYYMPKYLPSTDQLDIPRDINRDNITDQYKVTIELPLQNSISGQIINLWLLFQYTLNRFPLVNTETLGIISLKVPQSLNTNMTVSVYGDLSFQQREAILSYKNVSAIQGPIIDYGPYSVIPSFDDILNNYQLRNYSTKFNTQYVQWTSSPSTDGQPHLTIKVVVNIGTQLFRYVPSFWTEFRWTWIQYVTALLPFYYLMNKVKEFVFSNGLVRTVVKKFP